MYKLLHSHMTFFAEGGGDSVWSVGSSFLDQGLNSGPLQWKHRVLTIEPQGNTIVIPSFLLGLNLSVELLVYMLALFNF